jgi:hypothetical protein
MEQIMFEVDIEFKYAETRDFSIIEIKEKFFVIVKHRRKSTHSSQTAFKVLLKSGGFTLSAQPYTDKLSIESINKFISRFNSREDVVRRARKKEIAKVPALQWEECIYKYNPFRKFRLI